VNAPDVVYVRVEKRSLRLSSELRLTHKNDGQARNAGGGSRRQSTRKVHFRGRPLNAFGVPGMGPYIV
jgi:hypothetical protein